LCTKLLCQHFTWRYFYHNCVEYCVILVILAPLLSEIVSVHLVKLAAFEITGVTPKLRLKYFAIILYIMHQFNSLFHYSHQEWFVHTSVKIFPTLTLNCAVILPGKSNNRRIMLNLTNRHICANLIHDNNSEKINLSDIFQSNSKNCNQLRLSKVMLFKYHKLI